MPQGARGNLCLYMPRGYWVYPSIRGVITLDPILAGNILDNIYPIYLDIVLPDFGRSESSNELQCDPE